MKILAIDDKQDNLTVLDALVHDVLPEGKIITALNGLKGIELALMENPDVILLDILMPEMDGFAVCRQLKADPQTRDIPVIFLTALRTDKASRLKGLDVGAEAFLAKPIDETELIAQIRAMVKIKSANDFKRNEKEHLAKLVSERTRELEQSQVATLNLLEELKAENEVRRQTESVLRESEDRFYNLFERAPLGYQSLDENGNFIEVNQAWLDTLGYKLDEVAGKWFGDFLAPEFVETFRARFPLFKAAGKIHSEFEMLHRNGERRFITFDGRIGHNKDGSFQQTHCILKDITEQKQAEARIRQLIQHLEAVREEERTRISRELHDDIGQILTAIKIDLVMVHDDCNCTGAVKRRMDDMQKLLSEGIQCVHSLCRRLRPGALDDLGLEEAVIGLVEDWQQRNKIECKIEAKLLDDNLSDEMRTTVFRLVQEALTNVSRYAGASEVEIRLFLDDKNLCFSIADNGCGMEAGADKKPTSFGLLGMRERVEALAGTLRIISAPGKGTRIEGCIPLLGGVLKPSSTPWNF